MSYKISYQVTSKYCYIQKRDYIKRKLSGYNSHNVLKKLKAEDIKVKIFIILSEYYKIAAMKHKLYFK